MDGKPILLIDIKEELDRLLLDLNSAKKKGKEYATKEQNEAT